MKQTKLYHGVNPLSVILICVGLLAFNCWEHLQSQALPAYPAKLTSAEQVYDGDTLKDVRIHIADLDTAEGEVWPGIFVHNGQVFVETDIRIFGIDTPEKRPLKAGRTEESLAREKAAAAKAQQAVVDLLQPNDFAFTLSEPTLGKYAGRTVAHVTVNGVALASYLIEKGLAIEYTGGTKIHFDDWYEKDLTH